MIRYSGNVSYENEFKAHAKASTLFGALQFKYEYKGDSGLFLFGKKLKSKPKYDKEASEKETEEKKRKFNPEGIKKLINVSSSTVLKLIKHILPKEINGDFEFGFDDPYYTGKLLEIFVLLYATMGDKLKVRPVWDKTCFSGYFEMNGRICTLYVLILALKLWFNKEFKQIWREYYGK